MILLAIALAIGTAVLYAPALRNGFVNLDDPDYVTRNANVQQGLTWANVVWAFGTDNPASNWHPLTWISHMLDVQWYGTNAAGHHFTNVLLHTLDVLLLFLLLARATGEAMRSAAVAALFAVHPLNVEAVAWIADRKSVLCVLFFLLGMGAYGWYAKKPGVGKYLCVVLCFGLALMSKIMVITFPFVLLLLDYWPLGRLARTDAKSNPRPFFSELGKLVLEKIPLFAMAAAGGAMTLYVHAREHALAGAMPLNWRVKNGIFSYLAYLGKTVWPTRLAAFYPHPEDSLSWAIVGVAALLLAVITAIVWKYRERKYLAAGWLWFLGTTFPMVGFVQSGRQGMADRYMYIPMIGLLVAAIWFAGDFVAKKKWNAELATVALLLVTAPLAYLTVTQINYWRDSYTLFGHTLQVTSRNGIAENNFGSALMDRGQPQLASEHFEAAIRYIPDLASPHYNLAVVQQQENRLAEAERQYRTAIAMSVDPLEIAQSHNNLGMLYLATQNYPAALGEFNAAIAANANEQNSYLGRGIIEMQKFDVDTAVADFSRAAQIAPSPNAYFWLGRALEAKGDSQRAAKSYGAALQLAPGMSEARARLEALHANQGVPR